MSLPCEIALKCLLPPVRAMLAKELMEKHKLNQAEVAKILGVSQPAVSLYCRKLRGVSLNLDEDEKIMGLVKDFADDLARESIPRKVFILRFCEICRAVRAEGFLCEIHKKIDPSIAVEACELCKTVGARCF
ncbi:MAG: helix-turn-helix domain-containing protein [Candidatus Bathyarchaeia archaeon]